MKNPFDLLKRVFNIYFYSIHYQLAWWRLWKWWWCNWI